MKIPKTAPAAGYYWLYNGKQREIAEIRTFDGEAEVWAVGCEVLVGWNYVRTCYTEIERVAPPCEAEPFEGLDKCAGRDSGVTPDVTADPGVGGTSGAGASGRDR